MEAIPDEGTTKKTGLFLLLITILKKPKTFKQKKTTPLVSVLLERQVS